jgi:hypothetical protein
VLVQIDGLSREHLHQALQQGLMPNLKERLDSGQMVESAFRPGVPTQTGVVIAGMLYGRSVLPSNQWLDKATGQVPNVTGSRNSDLVEDSFLRSGARGLLEGGSAYLSPLSGHADRECFTLNELARVRRAGGRKAVLREVARDWAHLAWSLAVHPGQAVKTAVHWAADFGRGILARKGGQSLWKDRLKPAFWSATQNVWMTDASVRAMTRRMAQGDPVLFIDMPAYDDRSHAEGPEAALGALKNVDRGLGVLLQAASRGRRLYNVVLYSDHGSSESVSFQQLYGKTLAEYVASLLPPGGGSPGAAAGWPSPDPRLGWVDFGPGAHLYFRFSDQPLDGSQVEARYPGLTGRLVSHPAIAFAVTREGSATHIVGKQGEVWVQAGQVRVVGQNPLAAFGDEHITVHQIHDQAHRAGAGDVMVYGGFVGGKLVSFALHPQKGTHGGIGNTQDEAFLIQPAGLGIDTRQVDQAAEVYPQLAAILPPDAPAHQP